MSPCAPLPASIMTSDAHIPPRTELVLAHSADADDVFMWWPITGRIDASDPSRVLSAPAIDTGRFRFRALPGDIQQFNARAVASADLDISAVSFATYPRIADRYALCATGSSFGLDFGPKLVVRDEEGAADLAALFARGASFAVPGVGTSAFLTLSALRREVLGPGAGAEPMRVVEVPFEHVAECILSRRADAGVLIHEAQITYARQGLRLLADLGAWWGRFTGLPLPLGANVIRRDLDARFGTGSVDEVAHTLRASLAYALAHRDESLAYAKTFSPLKDDAELDRYVRHYVNELTIEPRPRGEQGVRRLLDHGFALGLLPRVDTIAFVG